MNETKYGKDGFPLTNFVKHVESYNSGGGCMLEIITLFNGQIICVSDECVTVHKDLDSFWADEGEATIVWFNDVELKKIETKVTELGELM